MDNQVHNQIVSFIWGIADDCLIISAAKAAGIEKIGKMRVNDDNDLEIVQYPF